MARRARTRLTGPPDAELDLGIDEPGPLGAPEGFELYSSGIETPVEPEVPGRWRNLSVTFVVLLVFATIGYVTFRVVTRGEDFDPSVAPSPSEQATTAP